MSRCRELSPPFCQGHAGAAIHLRSPWPFDFRCPVGIGTPGRTSLIVASSNAVRPDDLIMEKTIKSKESNDYRIKLWAARPNPRYRPRISPDVPSPRQSPPSKAGKIASSLRRAFLRLRAVWFFLLQRDSVPVRRTLLLLLDPAVFVLWHPPAKD